ncbi:UNVERIFIED_CONTAM: hypothetical protein PYX00_003266 [Menopon gallinae]|uniref:TROVE domain-containing protein n=1 Tax=Menopon gallinae TaxID=328185 RepID=A0AAW2HZC5_9NEOP
MASPEQRLKRFLHYGTEVPSYQPGNRLMSDAYQPTELPCIDAMIANEKASDVVPCIVKAFSDGYSAHPEMLIYALAYCAKQKSNPQLTAAAYKALNTVCTTPESLFLFVKFVKKLSPTKSVWGAGIRKAVKEWYLKKDAKTLAEIVTTRKKYHRWSHKDIMRLIHLKAPDPEKSAIIKYVFYGITTAKKEFADVAEIGEVLNYIQSIDDFKKMTDTQQAVRTLEALHLTLDHVPPSMLKNREIWSVLIGNLPLRVLINNLERLGYLGFLQPESPLVPRVLDALRNERLIAESRLHPAEVFVALKKYEMSSRYVAVEAAKKRKERNGSGPVTTETTPPPKPNVQILMAMKELFIPTCKLLAPTGLRYMVTLHMKPFGWHGWERCFHGVKLMLLEAGLVTALSLLHADRNVDVYRPFKTDTLTYLPIKLTTDMTVESALGVCMWPQPELPTYNPSSEIDWAKENNKQYDVFISIMARYNKTDSYLINKCLDSYRQSMNVPNAKVIILRLRSQSESAQASVVDHPGVLDIVGFDENVPRIIEAFSRGAF